MNVSFCMLIVPKPIRVEPWWPQLACTSEPLIMFAKSNKNNKNSPVRSEIVGKGRIEKTSAKKSVETVLSFPQIHETYFHVPFLIFEPSLLSESLRQAKKELFGKCRTRQFTRKRNTLQD